MSVKSTCISLANPAFAMEILDLISRVCALYGHLNVHIPSSSVHPSVMVVFKGIVHVNYLRLGK